MFFKSLNEMITYEELFPSVKRGALLTKENIPKKYKPDFANANMNKWGIGILPE